MPILQDTNNTDISKNKKCKFLCSNLILRGKHYQQFDMHPTRPITSTHK